jgi:hypothetical protein
MNSKLILAVVLVLVAVIVIVLLGITVSGIGDCCDLK